MITIPDTVLERKDVYSSGKMILAVISETPCTTTGAIARRLRMCRKTVSATMKQMRQRGIITATRSGKRWIHEIQP